jgi:hypothetical protein
MRSTRALAGLAITSALLGSSGFAAQAAWAPNAPTPCGVLEYVAVGKALTGHAETVHRTSSHGRVAGAIHPDCAVTAGANHLAVYINVSPPSGGHIRTTPLASPGTGGQVAHDTSTGNSFVVFHRGATCVLLASTTSPRLTTTQLRHLASAIYPHLGQS